MKTLPKASGRGGRIPVRGECKAGHVTETTSEPGRITWQGECGSDGCTHRITARRIPVTPGADSPPPPDDVHTPAEPEPQTVKEVDYGKQPEHRASDEPAPGGAAGDVPGAEEGAGPSPVRDVDELDPEPEWKPGEPDAPRGVIDESGPELVDRTPRRRRRERERVVHRWALPWER